jgi:hypothetical protein
MKVEWGFFGHRRINRMAVFTLPPEMIGFYKRNIEFVTEHAVDPDKRRYATKHEAVRHYIDIDHWGSYPFTEVPRNWTDVMMHYTDVYVVSGFLDTIQLFGKDLNQFEDGILTYKKRPEGNFFNHRSIEIDEKEYRKFIKDKVLTQYYEDEWKVKCKDLKDLFGKHGKGIMCQTVVAKDRFSEFGILPYNLVHMQSRLTRAFEEGDANKILRLSADMGHYIGDAHVPLHTTVNYNGQLTNQDGIHAFWESRIPELFADKDYDFLVGKAEYIDNPEEYYWDVVLTSHSMLDSVLAIEKQLSEDYPQDQQYCYEQRLDRTIRTQCTEYAAAYHAKLQGQIERRMRQSIRAIGSSWFTAWVDAGQPDLREMGLFKLTKKEFEAMKKEDEFFKQGKIKGREHW